MKILKGFNKRKKYIILGFLIVILAIQITSVTNVHASLSQGELKTMKKILVDHSELFKKNDIVMAAFRHVGWSITKFLADFAGKASDLFDTCFGFVDFTTWPKVSNYINKWKVVWGAVLSLSLLATGIIIMVWNEKKPKIFVNIVLAIFVISCSTYLLSQMNKFLNTDVRKEILGTNNSSGVIYETLGTCIHDLVFLDSKYGLKNLNEKNSNGQVKARITYNKMTEEQMNEIDITQTINPDIISSNSKYIAEYEMTSYPSSFNTGKQKTDDDGGLSDHLKDEMVTKEDLKNVMSNTIKIGDRIYVAEELYDGLAWTDAFNTYYFRYTVDYLSAILTMLSLVLIYTLLSFKVIKVIYENVIKEIVAIVQSANITQNQKTIKCLQSLRDGYIVLLITLVTIKIYMLATKYVSSTMKNGQDYKGWIMIFIAFAVIEGPSFIMQLTGMDSGSSDGASKIMSAYYGLSATAGAARMATGLTRKITGGAKNIGSFIKGARRESENKTNMDEMKKATETSGKDKDKNGPEKTDSMKDKVPPKGPGNAAAGNTGKGTQKNEYKDKNKERKAGSDNRINREKGNVPPKEGQSSTTEAAKTNRSKPYKNAASSEIKAKPQGKTDAKNMSPMQAKVQNRSNSARSMDAMKKDLSGGSGAVNISSEDGSKPLGATASSYDIEDNNGNISIMQEMKQALDGPEKKGKE